MIFTSGQLPLAGGELIATGHVGDGPGHVTVDQAAQCARVAAINAVAAAAALAGGVDNIAQVIRVTGYVACASDFTHHPAVVNGASDVLVEIFGDAGRHARSAVGVASLPVGAPVEIELVVSL
jgi:enamine deaminase RidA (YjgF/YER057c/UK114 family)